MSTGLALTVAEVGSLAAVAWRGDASTSLGIAPFVFLQGVQSLLSSNIVDTDTPNQCSSANKFLTVVACCGMLMVPLSWLLWSGRSILVEHNWIKGLVHELGEEGGEEERLLKQQAAAAAAADTAAAAEQRPTRGEGSVGGIEEEGGGEGGGATNTCTVARRVENLRNLFEKRHGIFNYFFPRLVALYVAMTAVFCCVTMWWAYSGAAPACSTLVAGIGQVWPIFSPPDGSNIYMDLFVRWVVPAGMFVAGQGAQFAFRGEYKKGRGYRIGWTAQLVVSFSCLFALPILLIVRGGRAALPLWSSVVALGAVVLAMEPLISKELVRRIKMVGPRSERLLAMVDEREAAFKNKQQWKAMMEFGAFDDDAVPAVPASCGAGRACRDRGCHSHAQEASPVARAGPPRMSVSELRAIYDQKRGGQNMV